MPKLESKKDDAAQDVALGDLTQDAIAAKVGTTRQTLFAWRQEPAFIVRVAELIEEHKSDIYSRGISHKHKRVKAVNDRWYRMQRLIEARADDPAMQGIPGGDTGLLVRTTKLLGGGPNATVIEEYTVDTGLLKELREHEKQAAIELGQWVEKQEAATPNETTPDAASRVQAASEGDAWRQQQIDKLSNMPSASPTPPTS